MKMTISPTNVGTNNGNYAREYNTDTLTSVLLQDVSDDTVGLREYSDMAELVSDYVREWQLADKKNGHITHKIILENDESRYDMLNGESVFYSEKSHLYSHFFAIQS